MLWRIPWLGFSFDWITCRASMVPCHQIHPVLAQGAAMDPIINFTLTGYIQNCPGHRSSFRRQFNYPLILQPGEMQAFPFCLQLLKFPGASGSTHVHQSSWWVNRAWRYNTITKKPSGSMIKSILDDGIFVHPEPCEKEVCLIVLNVH